MKIYKCNIVTCDKNENVFNYLVEDCGKIVYVGDTLPLEYTNTEIIDLGEKALIPPFADSHIHFASFATFHAGLNIMNARSKKRPILGLCPKMKNHPLCGWFFIGNCGTPLIRSF